MQRNQNDFGRLQQHSYLCLWTELKNQFASNSQSIIFLNLMAVPSTETENNSSSAAPQTPLLETSLQQREEEEEEELNDDTQLSKSLQRLETFLRLFGFCQYSSIFSFTLSWFSFLLLGVALPVFIIKFPYCSNDTEKYDIKVFELEILVSQSLVAAISLICISHNLRKYGVRKFLFVDRHHGHMAHFHEEYIQKIDVSYPA